MALIRALSFHGAVPYYSPSPVHHHFRKLCHGPADPASALRQSFDHFLMLILVLLITFINADDVRVLNFVICSLGFGTPLATNSVQCGFIPGQTIIFDLLPHKPVFFYHMLFLKLPCLSVFLEVFLSVSSIYSVDFETLSVVRF